jgi:ABC-type siderophore export system fused ATPase/permease subunit
MIRQEVKFEEIDKRFEQVDKRLVELREDMNKRLMIHLHDLNLRVSKGARVGFVGTTGRVMIGQIDRTDLDLGLQIPEKGEDLIDGMPFGDWKQNSFRERIGLIEKY